MRKRFRSRLSRGEFEEVLDVLLPDPSAVVMVHASMRDLYVDFNKREILPMLRERTRGLIFPAWHFRGRAEEYYKTREIVFDTELDPSAMGALSEAARHEPDAYRTPHPHRSCVLLSMEERPIAPLYGCGWGSPFAWVDDIIGIGVTVENLTFCHHVEQIMGDEFPVQTLMPKPVTVTVRDRGNVFGVTTYVPCPQTYRRVSPLFRSIPPSVCLRFKRKGIPFFSAGADRLRTTMVSLAKAGKTIYTV